MGVALYVALEKPLLGFDASSVDGKALTRAQERLDGIARRKGLTPLEDFFSSDPDEVRALLEDEGGFLAAGAGEGRTARWRRCTRSSRPA